MHHRNLARKKIRKTRSPLFGNYLIIGNKAVSSKLKNNFALEIESYARIDHASQKFGR